MQSVESTLSQARALFDLPRHVVYFNCAYMSPLLKSVASAGTVGIQRKGKPWETMPEHFFNESNEARGLFGSLIDAPANHVALVPSVSYGIGVAAANVDVPKRSKIVLLADQFPSNVYPWMEKARQSEAQIHTIARPTSGGWTPAVLEALTADTAVAALPNCHWTDGSLLDLEAIGKRCRELDIALVLDLTQSLGALPFSIESIRPAFVAAAGYKWLMGPYSTAFLYADARYHGGVPLEFNWITRDDSANFAGLVNYTDRLATDASRFDVGERSNFTLLPMLIAALRQIHAWQPAAIQTQLRAYNDRLAEAASSLGFQTLPADQRAGHILGLRFPGRLPQTLAKQLADNHIFISIRGDSIRVAPHLYNDETDLETFIEHLTRLI